MYNTWPHHALSPDQVWHSLAFWLSQWINEFSSDSVAYIKTDRQAGRHPSAWLHTPSTTCWCVCGGGAPKIHFIFSQSRFWFSLGPRLSNVLIWTCSVSWPMRRCHGAKKRQWMRLVKAGETALEHLYFNSPIEHAALYMWKIMQVRSKYRQNKWPLRNRSSTRCL